MIRGPSIADQVNSDRDKADLERASIQFHGTKADLKSIKKRGLEPGFAGTVFTTLNRDVAAMWAGIAQARSDASLLRRGFTSDKVGKIFEIHIPSDGWDHFRQTARRDGYLELSILETHMGTGIPASWIKGYYDTTTTPRFGQGPVTTVSSDLKKI